MAIKFSEFQPTSLDTKGKGSEGQEDWLVLPVSITRDTTECVTLSNWEIQQRICNEKFPDKLEVLSFNHWGPGWFEICVVPPEMADLVEEIEGCLENYPILDEMHYSEVESESRDQYWDLVLESELEKAFEEFEHPTCFTELRSYELLGITHYYEYEFTLADYWNHDLCDKRQLFEEVIDELCVYWEVDSSGATLSLTDEIINEMAYRMTDEVDEEDDYVDAYGGELTYETYI